MTWSSFNYVHVQRAALTAAECEELIEVAQQRGVQSGNLGRARVCDLAWVHNHPLVERLASCAGPYAFDVTSQFVGAAQVARYEAGGKYDWHMDLGPGPMSLRKVSMVAELRSADQGGGLEVFAIGELNLRAGDVAVFPSFIMHRALPVVSGRRWSAAVWRLGDEPLR